MSSKSDILKKYGNVGKSRNDGKKKKSKVSTKFHVVDDELGWDSIAPTSDDVSRAWENDDDEDKPIVVPSLVEDDSTKKVGMWVEEAIITHKPSPYSHSIESSKTEKLPVNVSLSRSDKVKYDSDASPPRRRTTDSDASPPRRHDSDSDASPPRRHDSDSDASPPRRRYDSDESPPRKTNIKNSNDSQSPAALSIRKNEQEQELSKNITDTNMTTKDTTIDNSKKRRKTNSGHDAGLQSASQFGQAEKELQKTRDLELKDVNPELSGAKADTVYRDRRGKKLDMLSEFMRQQAVREGKDVKLEKAQFEWGKGIVQKQDILNKQQELAELANQPFARTVDDPTLERNRKEIIRDDDPMAEYFREKQSLEEEKELKISNKNGKMSSKPVKPKYRGPTSAPNRFNILPGYRWDGVDRGNGFEHKLLKKANDKTALREDEYRWSTSDM